MKTLTFEEKDKIIEKFQELKNRDFMDKVITSTVVYENNFDLGYADYSLTIYDYNDYLYIKSVSNGITTVRPLLIQVSPEESIVEFTLLDFVIRFRQVLNLDKYFILVSDYSCVMNEMLASSLKEDSSSELEKILRTVR